MIEGWELAAREQVRDTLATYNHAGDRFRLADLAGCFAEEGVLEIRGGSSASGRSAIISMLSGARREPAPAGEVPVIRHFVSNVVFADATPASLRVEAYFQVLTQHGLDHWGRYRDRWIFRGDDWKIAHRLVIVDGMVPCGWYASSQVPGNACE